MVLSAPTSARGSVVMRQCTEWVSTKQKERANILKQQRLLTEERPSGDSGSGSGRGGGGGGGKGKEKGKPKAPPKEAAEGT